MDVIFIICLFVIQYTCMIEVDAVYNRDVTCVIDEGQIPVCKVSPKVRRRSAANTIQPSHDPYIPRNHATLYNCTAICTPVIFNSMTELTSPSLFLKSCFIELTKEDDYACETIRYNYFKNIDKLLFLSKTIRNKSFYLVDCLIYSDGGRVCHRKDDVASHAAHAKPIRNKSFYLVDCLIYSDGGRVCHRKDDVASHAAHAKLVDIGTLVRPNETDVLSQDEFICEEDEAKNVQCDLNPFVPFEDGLKMKEVMKFDDNVLLKTKSYVIELKRGCIESWCGYTGKISPSRRQFSYIPPGGQLFRCFYANKQQVCKQWGNPREVYNQRSWLDT